MKVETNTKAVKGKTKYISAVGRRKRGIARVRLYQGKGQSLVNQKSLEEYFSSVPQSKYLKPFTVTETSGKFYVTAKVSGGGVTSQLGAYTHGVSRALAKHEPKLKPTLRKAGLITRDPRERERRKYGLAQSARAKKQSPKR